MSFSTGSKQRKQTPINAYTDRQREFAKKLHAPRRLNSFIGVVGFIQRNSPKFGRYNMMTLFQVEAIEAVLDKTARIIIIPMDVWGTTYDDRF